MQITRRQLLAASALAPLALHSTTLAEVHLSVSSDEIDEDIAVATKFLGGFGVQYLEIRSIFGKYNTEQPLEMIRAARATMDAAKVRTCVVDSAFFRAQVPVDNAALEKEWTLLDAAMDRAEILGTNVVRTFGFMPKKGETPQAKDFPHIYELELESAKRAKKRGMRLAVENLAGGYFSTGADLAKLQKNVQHDSFGVTWDPNNAAAAGEKSFPDGYKLLDPARIFHVHLRDFKHMPDGKVEWTAVGAGEFDNLSQIRSLLKTGYKGAFNLETHFRIPEGKAAATRISLTALLEIVKKV
jgi:sugar phosphate isomerase/epimerase